LWLAEIAYVCTNARADVAVAAPDTVVASGGGDAVAASAATVAAQVSSRKCMGVLIPVMQHRYNSKPALWITPAPTWMSLHVVLLHASTSGAACWPSATISDNICSHCCCFTWILHHHSTREVNSISYHNTSACSIDLLHMLPHVAPNSAETALLTQLCRMISCLLRTMFDIVTPDKDAKK
jgi:hypothetical protein